MSSGSTTSTSASTSSSPSESSSEPSASTATESSATESTAGEPSSTGETPSESAASTTASTESTSTSSVEPGSSSSAPSEASSTSSEGGASSTESSAASSSSSSSQLDADGTPCVGGDTCQTGFCVDGFCCNVACAGACLACSGALTGRQNGACGDVPSGVADPRGICTSSDASTCGDQGGLCNGNGGCALWPSQTVCSDALCNDDVLTPASTCDGAGHCDAPVPPTQQCAPYLCQGDACTSGCGGDEDCAPGNFCLNPGAPGTCVATEDQGQPCTAGDQCLNGKCYSGVCCNTVCTGLCEACSAAEKGGGSDGVCGAVAAGQPDPSGACISQPASTCGEEGGTCNGAGACTTWPTGTVCVAAFCSSATALTRAETCANEACDVPQPATEDCTPYLCENAACSVACADDSQCATSAYCQTPGPQGVCVDKASVGTACTASDQCQAGNCVSGYCCSSPCAGPCQACSEALTGQPNGICADWPGPGC